MGRMVQGEGAMPASVLLIGQRPGYQEAKQGRPFCGPSGQELNRYLLYNSGIDRASVFVTNLVKDYHGEDDVTDAEVERDMPLLIEEIKAVRPRFVGLLGLIATRALLGPDMDMDWAHGLHFPGNSRPYTCMPLYHPAAGLHQPNLAARVAWDFAQFGKLVRGEALPTGHLADPHPSPEYLETAGMHSTGGSMALDTEGSAELPWCVSASCWAGAGRVVRNRNIHIGGTAILHNSLHDLPVLASMGIHPSRWEDTMVKAAHVGVEPLSLKSLCRRHCGMSMAEYADVVRGARRELALEYLGSVLEWILSKGGQG